MYALTAFGSTNLPTGAPVIDLDSGPSVSGLVPLPGGGVYDAHGTEMAPRGSTQITFQAVITGASASAIDTTFEALKALRGKRDQLWRTMGDGATLQWCYARLQTITAQRTASTRKHLPISMTFQMLDQNWANLTVHNDTYTGASPKAIANQTNSGNVTQAIMTITITAVTSSITAVTLANADSGHSFSWAGTLLATKALIINTGTKSIKNNGVDAFAGFTPPTNKPEWFALIADQNDLTFTRTGGDNSSSINLNYWDAWG